MSKSFPLLSILKTMKKKMKKYLASRRHWKRGWGDVVYASEYDREEAVLMLEDIKSGGLGPGHCFDCRLIGLASSKPHY
jgi:hypothetical protein